MKYIGIRLLAKLFKMHIIQQYTHRYQRQEIRLLSKKSVHLLSDEF